MALEPDDRGNGEHGACPAAFAVHAGVVGDELRRRRTATADGDKRLDLPIEATMHGAGDIAYFAAGKVDDAQPTEAAFVARQGNGGAVRRPRVAPLARTLGRLAVLERFVDQRTVKVALGAEDVEVQPSAAIGQVGKVRSDGCEARLLHGEAIGR